MIYFEEILNMAFNLFDDPDISRKYYYDRAGFQRDMLDYLMIGLGKTALPQSIMDQLILCDQSQTDQIEGDGDGNSSYALEGQPIQEHSAISFRIGNEFVSGSYDKDTNTVTFNRKVNIGEKWYVDAFYAGAFTGDFKKCLRSDFNMKTIIATVKRILAYATLSAWGDKEVGRVLEVRNILTDTDFKLYSPANSAKAKMEWRDKMNANVDTLVVNLNWMIMGTPKGGNRFGK